MGKNKYNTLGNVNVILRKTRKSKQLGEIQEHLFNKLATCMHWNRSCIMLEEDTNPSIWVFNPSAKPDSRSRATIIKSCKKWNKIKKRRDWIYQIRFLGMSYYPHPMLIEYSRMKWGRLIACIQTSLDFI